MSDRASPALETQGAPLSVRLPSLFPQKNPDAGAPEPSQGPGAMIFAQEAPRSFMQSLFWARFKSSTGWKPYQVEYQDPDGRTAELLVLLRPLILGFSFAYVPHGPTFPAHTRTAREYLETLSAALIPHLDTRLLFIRFDLDWEIPFENSEGLLDLFSGKLRRGSAVQVPDTVILNLGKTETELLSAMKPKWRYNIRLAEKRGVEISRQGSEGLPIFYELYRTTALRDGIAIHPISYYEKLFDTARAEGKGTAEEPRLSVWVASHESEPLAAIITLYQAEQAIYLYGASSDQKRNLMPAYAIQWAAIKAAKKEGCAFYDFFGIPPNDDPSHPMAGLYLFKTGFGGRIVHRLGSVDYSSRPLLYGLFRSAETLRLFWFKKIKKLLKKGPIKSAGV